MKNIMDHFRRSIVTILVFIFGFGFRVDGEGLSFDFYEKSCPQLESVVAGSFRSMFLADPTTPAALLRLMFHDCQVQGCDASILLDPIEKDARTEMGSGKNFGIRKRETIDVVKSIVEAECPGQVSCADILVLAAREAVEASGGPRIRVPLGRRDCTAAPSHELADASLPPANVNVDGMLRAFALLGMTTEEAVAILGSHTIGVTHCLNIMNRLYKPQGGEIKGMEPSFVAFLRLTCPVTSVIGNSSIVLNDLTMLTFDNHYYANAKQGRGVLNIDSEIVSDPRTAPIVERFSSDQGEFFRVFSSAFVKLSLTSVLTRDQGVIRRKCNAM